MKKLTLQALAVLLCAAGTAGAAEIGEEVDVTSGAVTALSCALEIQKTKKLDLLTACPLAEAKSGLVVFDVAESVIYALSAKKVHRHELESAFGGGRIDFTGKVVSVAKQNGVATVDVAEYTITKKPKPGSFKGCL